MCMNCGKLGHQSKYCIEPILSYGIICFNLNSDIGITNKTIENYFYNKFIDLSEFNYSNLNNINLIPYFYNKVKVLMIRRKNSLNYIEFIRGKYNVLDKKQLYNLFKLMTKDENIKIRNSSFDILWEDLWKETAKSKMYHKEYNLSKLKFEELKVNNFYNLLNDDNLSNYTEPEWGFPKGRRNFLEKNLNCAIREFQEETNISLNNLHLLERLNCIDEEYIGTNLINYKHVYYMASSESELEVNININNNNQTYEIGDISWFTIPEAIEKMRPYYEKRIKMIHQLYFFIINLITDINKSQKGNTNILV